MLCRGVASPPYPVLMHVGQMKVNIKANNNENPNNTAIMTQINCCPVRDPTSPLSLVPLLPVQKDVSDTKSIKPKVLVSAVQDPNFDSDFTKLAVEQPHEEEVSSEVGVRLRVLFVIQLKTVIMFFCAVLQAVNLFPGFSFVDPSTVAKAAHHGANGESSQPVAKPVARSASTGDVRTNNISSSSAASGDKMSTQHNSQRVQEVLDGSPQRLTHTTSAQSSRSLVYAFSSLMSSPKRKGNKTNQATPPGTPGPTAAIDTSMTSSLMSPNSYSSSPLDSSAPTSPYYVNANGYSSNGINPASSLSGEHH
jgi:hypothetical protein